MFYILIILGSLIGIFLGRAVPIIPYTYSVYLSVGILAALDSVFGAIAAIIHGKFDFKVFISGLFGNAVLTMALTYLGAKLNIDIYIGAIIVFVSRMFNNLSIIRRYYIDKWYQRYENMKKHYLHVQTDIEYLNSNDGNK